MLSLSIFSRTSFYIEKFSLFLRRGGLTVRGPQVLDIVKITFKGITAYSLIVFNKIIIRTITIETLRLLI